MRSGRRDRVVLACRDAVGRVEPASRHVADDWARWQRALDDVPPWNQPVGLADL